MSQINNHYEFLEANLIEFFDKIGVNTNVNNKGIIVAHGDKCEQYKCIWKEAGIHFYHGALLLLVSYCSPYNKTCRITDENGQWIHGGLWVIKHYDEFKYKLPIIE